MGRAIMLLAAVGLVAASCATESASTGTAPSEQPDGAPSDDLDEAPSDAVEPQAQPGREPIRTESMGCEQGEFHWTQPGCEPATSIDLDEMFAGGPPPDGIPPIDDPVYESLEEAATWLDDTSPVMVVDVDGDVRAFPLGILTWHEIVNDDIGGVPLTVTYCPLCNSALVFERTIDGPDGPEVLDFGTSGRLYRSNLVMYDRQHRNLWTQFDGEAVVGDRYLGDRLTRVPAWLFGFAELADLHPDAQVLSRETGYNRDYGRNPYTGYDAQDNNPSFFRGDLDDRHPPMERLVGLATEDDEAVAILLDLLVDSRVVEVDLGGRSVVVVWAPGQASALDTTSIDDGREVGQTAAFVAEIDGEPVDLEPGDDGSFVDRRSGSTFDLRGRAVDGPLAGQQLAPIVHDDTFWFVWLAFRPDTEVVTS